MKLKDFVWMPYSDSGEDYRRKIAAVAIDEDWGQDLRYLMYYVADNFEIAQSQGKVKVDPEDRYCLWRVGTLSTREGEPISILALRNRRAEPPYEYTTIFDRSRFTVRSDGMDIPEEAPDAPSYEIPDYRTDYRLTYNFTHYLEDHEERVAEKLKKLNPHQRFLCIFAALQLAHKRGGQSAVPQWFCDKNATEGTYQWLLPLHISSETISQKPDFVAVLRGDDNYSEYHIPTIIPPEWAYGHARAVSNRDPQFRSWA